MLPLCVLILMPMLSACAHVDGRDAPLARKLPPPPASLQPVPLPKIVAGQDVRVSRFDHRQALIKANTRIVNSRGWYEQVRKDHGAIQ